MIDCLKYYLCLVNKSRFLFYITSRPLSFNSCLHSIGNFAEVHVYIYTICMLLLAIQKVFTRFHFKILYTYYIIYFFNFAKKNGLILGLIMLRPLIVKLLAIYFRLELFQELRQWSIPLDVNITTGIRMVK